MLETALSFLFSLIDFSSVFILIMAIFDISFKSNYKKMIISIIFCAALSHIIIYLGLHTHSLLVLIPAVYLIFRLYFKESKQYALWIVLYGYLSILLMQYLLVYAFLKFDFMTNEEVIPFSVKGYIIQSLTCFYISMISIMIRRSGRQYSFTFDNVFGRKKASLKTVKYYMLTAIFVYLYVSMVYPSYYGQSVNSLFYMNLFLTFLCFAVLFIMSFIRNQNESKTI